MNKKFEMKIDLYDAIDYIQNYDNNFIVNFLEDARITRVKRKILGYYSYNLEDIKSELDVLIIEFVMDKFDLEDYQDEETFLEQMKNEVARCLITKVRRGYGRYDIPFSNDHDTLANQSVCDDTSYININEFTETLTQREMDVFNLCYVRDLKEEDAAKLLDVTQQAVNQAKLRIVKKFTKL